MSNAKFSSALAKSILYKCFCKNADGYLWRFMPIQMHITSSTKNFVESDSTFDVWVVLRGNNACFIIWWCVLVQIYNWNCGLNSVLSRLSKIKQFKCAGKHFKHILISHFTNNNDLHIEKMSVQASDGTWQQICCTLCTLYNVIGWDRSGGNTRDKHSYKLKIIINFK